MPSTGYPADERPGLALSVSSSPSPKGMTLALQQSAANVFRGGAKKAGVE